MKVQALTSAQFAAAVEGRANMRLASIFSFLMIVLLLVVWWESSIVSACISAAFMVLPLALSGSYWLHYHRLLKGHQLWEREDRNRLTRTNQLANTERQK